jgi:hypothetical protein
MLLKRGTQDGWTMTAVSRVPQKVPDIFTVVRSTVRDPFPQRSNAPQTEPTAYSPSA